MRVIDATCPLVTKVHQEARKFAAKGYDIVLIGHEGHEEVVGTMGHAPGPSTWSATRTRRPVEVADPERVAYLTQTTLSVDETAGVIGTLRERFPVLAGPRSDDICYATQNRQAAVKTLARRLPAGPGHRGRELLQLGPPGRGRPGRRASRSLEASAVDPAWFEGVDTVGVSSGASAPEWLVDELVEALRERGATEVREVEVVPEDVHFALPGNAAPGRRGGPRGNRSARRLDGPAGRRRLRRRRRAGRARCARRLHEKGVAAVLEASDGVGGRVRTDRVDDFLLDRGFQALLTAYPEAAAALDWSWSCIPSTRGRWSAPATGS